MAMHDAHDLTRVPISPLDALQAFPEGLIHLLASLNDIDPRLVASVLESASFGYRAAMRTAGILEESAGRLIVTPFGREVIDAADSGVSVSDADVSLEADALAETVASLSNSTVDSGAFRDDIESVESVVENGRRIDVESELPHSIADETALADVALSIEPQLLPILVHDAAILRGYRESAGNFRYRLVSPDTQIVAALLAAGAEGLSQADLARTTRLSLRTIASVLNDLRTRRLLNTDKSCIEDRSDHIVAIDSDSYAVIGINLMGSHLIGVLTDLIVSSDIVRLERTLPTAADEDAAIAIMVDLATELRAAAQGKEDGLRHVIGIGVELGGHVDSSSTTVVTTPNLPWTDKVDLANKLRLATNLTTVVENDANALALYQCLYGPSLRYTDSFVVILLDDGIGAGVIVDRRLVRGYSGGAGEIGHLPVGDHAEKCHCGNLGCLEATASARSIVRRSRKASKSTSVESLATAANLALNDEAVMAVFESAGDSLGRALACVANLLDPEAILIELPAELNPQHDPTNVAARHFIRHMHDAAASHSFSTTYHPSKVRISNIQDDAVHGARGAAAAVLSAFVENPLDERFFHGMTNDNEELSSMSLSLASRLAGRRISLTSSDAQVEGEDTLASLGSKVVALLDSA